MKLFFLFIISTINGFSQIDSIVVKFNNSSNEFNNIRLNESLTFNGTIDSINSKIILYDFDEQNHLETETRFKGTFFNRDCSYYIFELDNKVHLLHIEILDIDTMDTKKVYEFIDEKIGFLDLSSIDLINGETLRLKRNYCNSLFWLKYSKEQNILTIQISDKYYCQRFQF